MNISEIRAVTVELAPNITTKPRVERQDTDGFISPMRRYPEFRRADESPAFHNRRFRYGPALTDMRPVDRVDKLKVIGTGGEEDICPSASGG